uniref:Transposase n=1 Tax=Ascaris lumbricoides TaxID=6252 RepID=A0A0M3HP67_ASCLU
MKIALARPFSPLTDVKTVLSYATIWQYMRNEGRRLSHDFTSLIHKIGSYPAAACLTVCPTALTRERENATFMRPIGTIVSASRSPEQSRMKEDSGSSDRRTSHSLHSSSRSPLTLRAIVTILATISWHFAIDASSIQVCRGCDGIIKSQGGKKGYGEEGINDDD